MKVIGRKQTLSISNTLLVPRSFVLRSLYGSEAKMRTFLSHLHNHGLLIETHFAEALDGCGDRRVLCVVLCCVVLRFVCRVVLRWALSCFILASYTATNRGDISERITNTFTSEPSFRAECSLRHKNVRKETLPLETLILNQKRFFLKVQNPTELKPSPRRSRL
jgi:hypothetical protein